MKAIEALYFGPMAAVRLPHAISGTFHIFNGTRQGCHAATLRFCPDMRGVLIQGRELKISLFADDYLLTITNPLISLPNLHANLDGWGVLSRYKLNTTKSEALLLNCKSGLTQALCQNFPYSWKTTCITYLGIKLTPTCDSLCHANYTPLLRDIQSLLTKWKALPISFFSRIA